MINELNIKQQSFATSIKENCFS